MEEYVVIVKAVTNDADYVEQCNYIDEKEILDLLRIVGAIREYTEANKYKRNWPWANDIDETVEDIYGDKLSRDDIEFMEGFTPYNIHSIESIRILKVIEDIKIF